MANKSEAAAVAEQVRRLRSGSRDERLAAVARLGELKSRLAIEGLVEAICDLDKDQTGITSMQAAHAMAALGKDAIPALVKLLGFADMRVNVAAIQGLVSMPEARAEVIAALREFLKGPQRVAGKLYAADGLSMIGTPEALAVAVQWWRDVARMPPSEYARTHAESMLQKHAPSG